MYLEEKGWVNGCTQWDARILSSGDSVPVDPTSRKYAPPRDDNYNTLNHHHPPGRRRGYAFSQSRPSSPGVQPMGWRWPCRERTRVVREGRVRGRRARVESPEVGSSRGAGSARWQLPNSATRCLFCLGFGRAGRSPTKEDPSKVSEFPRVKGTNNNNST